MQRTKLVGFLFGAALALATFMPSPSLATILFAGGEDVDFTFIGSVSITTSAGQFRSGYARESVGAANSSTASDPPTNRFLTPVVANQTVLWIHGTNVAGLSSTTANNQMIGVYGSDGVRRLLVRQTGTNGQVKISKRDSGGTITDLVTCTVGAWPIGGGTQKLDWFVNYAVAGEVTLYVNGTQFCDYVGDVTTNSVTAVNQVDFAGQTSSAGINWSEVILSTTDTRSMNILTCYPVANGTNMAWTGSFANVNGTTANDATPLTSSASNQVGEFTCPALPAGSFSVPAVTQTARLLKGASGPQTFRFIIRPSSGSTDYDNGSDLSLTTNFANYSTVWSLNPACSCSWTTADVTTGVNQGAKSRP